MSLTIGSISGSFDDFSLPEDEQNSGQLGDKKVNDFTKIPFYKNKAFVQSAIIASTLGLTCLNLYAFFHVIPSALDDYDPRYYFIGVGLSTIIALSGIGYALSYKGYDDPTSRKNFRLELENDKITVIQFINTHGWENIRRWGFFIPEDQQPLCTKQLLVKKILKDVPTEQFWNYLRSLKYHKDSVTIRTQYIAITYHFGLYQMSKPMLWEAIEHKIFTDEQKVEISKEFEKRLVRAKGCELLANWRYMKEAGFNKNPAFKRIYEWLEKNQEKYEEIEKLFNEQITIWLAKMGARKYDFHIQKDIPKVSEELVKTLPTFNDGWFTGVPGHINNLNALNGWFANQLAEFDNEFKTLLA